MQRLRIAIDPELKRQHGPEICWAWRVLLSSTGYVWQEVPVDSPDCDVAYVGECSPLVPCKLRMRSNEQWWREKSSLRLTGVLGYDGYCLPAYEGESNGSSILCNTNGTLECQRDLIFDLFWLASGQEEQHWSKDRHGFYDLDSPAFIQRMVLSQALASGIGTSLKESLCGLGLSPSVPLWPCGKTAAACVGHDVDYPEVIRWLEPWRVIRRQGLQGGAPALSVLAGQRNHWHFSSWTQMEQAFDVHSAFYFVARKGSLFQYATGTPDPFYDVRRNHFRKAFEYLSDQGFEIGLHASYRAYESRQKFAAEKHTLEEASGQPVCGNRHHYWHLNPDDPESTLLIHEQIGLQYDSSLIHERYIGWRRGLCWPYFPFHQAERRELRTLQIPTAWMDDHLFGHRQHNPGNGHEILRTLVDSVARHHGCLLIDVHDYVFDDALFPGWARIYGWLLQHLSERGDFWIDTPKRIAEHWIDRYSSILRHSKGLSEGVHRP